MIYQPLNVPQDPKDLAAWLTNELRRLGQSLGQSVNSVQLNPLPVAPAKPREGLVVMANGTNWNPGSGAGVYVYRGGAWQFLG